MTPAQSKIKEWRADPVKFVWDNFKVTPDAWQVDVLRDFGNQDIPKMRLSLQACVGPGKSAILSWCGWNFLSCYGEVGNHPKGAAVSVTEKNLKDNLWPEYAKWQSRSPYLMEAFQWTKERIYAKDFEATWFMSARSFNKDADAEAQGRTLSGLHSKYVLVQLDESGEIPLPVLKAGEQAMAETDCKVARMMQAGNPSSLDGILYAAANQLAHLWKVHRITGDPDDPKRSPRIDIEWAREQIKTYGPENPWVLYSILGKFPPTSINSLLGPDQVRAAMQRTVRADAYEFTQKRLGIDVAFEGDDTTVIFPRQGVAAFKFVVMKNAKSADIAARVMMAKKNFGSEMEFIDDTGGWSKGVQEFLAQAGISTHPVNFSGKAIDPRYYNIRAEMYWNMSEWVKNGGCLPYDEQLLRELCAPTYTLRNGKILLEDKKQIKSRLGFSPDCFVAGTLVRTPEGNRPIESLKAGDEVTTPMGTRTVLKAWESETDSLTTAKFSNGRALSGKGKHEIFTWDMGWVRLDALALTNEIESDSIFNRGSWWLRRLFTTGKPLGFKATVGTTSHTRKRKSDFFTAGFGATIMGLFQKATTSTTRTVTGEITALKIWNSWRALSTTPIICERTWPSLALEPRLLRASRKPSLPHPLGTRVLKGWLGTQRTGKSAGKAGEHLRLSAPSAGSQKSHSSQPVEGSAHTPASRLRVISGLKRLLVTALSAVRNSFLTSIGLRPVVPVSVRTDTVKSRKVYNLTLDADNVYYANGILVSNCADALALTFALPDMPAAMNLGIPGLDGPNKMLTEWDPYK